MTARVALAWLQQQLTERYDQREARNIAHIVLEDAFGYRATAADRSLTEAEEQRLQDIHERLLTGEPMQYVLGEADFYGLRFQVDPRVLIPRPETEELVYWTLQTIRSMEAGSKARVLDVGTGSGCIPIAIKHEAPQLDVHGLDVRSDILELALENAKRNGVEISWHQADVLYEPLPFDAQSLGIIVSNPPYIPPSERSLIPEHVQAFEPHLALFVPEDDPLLFYRRLAELAGRYLQPSGYLIVESNEHFARRVAEVFEKQGLQDVTIKEDMAGKERMVRGRRIRK